MATKYINRISQLPKEFGLSKYDRVSKFSRFDWLMHLINRSQLINDVEKRDAVFDVLENLRNPLFDSEKRGHELFKCGLMAEYEETKSTRKKLEKIKIANYQKHRVLNELQVRSTSLLDVYESVPNFCELNIDRDLADYVFIDEFDPAFFSTKLHLTIDISQSDDVIYKQLEFMINAAREKRGLEKPFKKFSQANRRKLVEYKVLPYLDLFAWSRQRNVIVKPSVYMIALAPQGELSERQIVENVHSLAMYAISDPFIKLIANEIEFYVHESDEIDDSFCKGAD